MADEADLINVDQVANLIAGGLTKRSPYRKSMQMKTYVADHA